jgi:activator of HSP90 ATPase
VHYIYKDFGIINKRKKKKTCIIHTDFGILINKRKKRGDFIGKKGVLYIQVFAGFRDSNYIYLFTKFGYSFDILLESSLLRVIINFELFRKKRRGKKKE